jgi:hypothetical protein
MDTTIVQNRRDINFVGDILVSKATSAKPCLSEKQSPSSLMINFTPLQHCHYIIDV